VDKDKKLSLKSVLLTSVLMVPVLFDELCP